VRSPIDFGWNLAPLITWAFCIDVWLFIAVLAKALYE
jgi:hypothetical protein